MSKIEKYSVGDICGEIKFSCNWNNKLVNKYFTTIRLAPFKEGDLHYVKCKDIIPFVVRVEKVSSCTLPYLPAITAAVDTGYDLATTKEIIKRMYPSIKDWNSQQIQVVLLHNLDYKK